MSNILIAGGSGLVGTRLSRLLTEADHSVAWLSRSQRSDVPYPVYHWDVEASELATDAVDWAEVIINLAGAGIADQLWTASRKKTIVKSRTASTDLLRRKILESKDPPSRYISASAIGYYGDRGTQWLSETAEPGNGFLSTTTRAWEDAAHQIKAEGIPVYIVRIGVVLSTQGGALPKMLLPLKLKAATYFGDGEQYYSWIHIDDLCRIFMHLATNPDVAPGTYNGVAPQPVTNKALMQSLATLKGGAVLLPAPKFALKMGMGEMAHVVLDSARVKSKKIEGSGFVFKFPTVEHALTDVLERQV